MDLFDVHLKDLQEKIAPLADRVRPTTLEEFVGQEHLIGEGKPLLKLIQKDVVVSMIFWGPPGSGKTTLARIISLVTKRNFVELSAVSAGVADLRRVVEQARDDLKLHSRQTILFIDEVHRFNKAQQDAILPYVENGTITMIGSTTENPTFEVIPALRSRCHIFQLENLSYDDIGEIIRRALIQKEKGLGSLAVQVQPEAMDVMILHANGDARYALNALESSVYSVEPDENGVRVVDRQVVADVTQRSALLYDKMGSAHYDHASAFQKSLRGSDPDAAIYWLAKMIAAGEEPRFIARRLIVTAAEDVGNADPMALVVAMAAAQASEYLGFPEARIPLAQAVLYVATAPKSNATITAVDAALSDIQEGGKSFPVPKHLRDSHYREAKKYGHGVGYIYPHSRPEEAREQSYLPAELIDRIYYKPGPRGVEGQRGRPRKPRSTAPAPLKPSDPNESS